MHLPKYTSGTKLGFVQTDSVLYVLAQKRTLSWTSLLTGSLFALPPVYTISTTASVILFKSTLITALSEQIPVTVKSEDFPVIFPHLYPTIADFFFHVSFFARLCPMFFTSA